jgi:hypothetical protein
MRAQLHALNVKRDSIQLVAPAHAQAVLLDLILLFLGHISAIIVVLVSIHVPGQLLVHLV